MADPFKYERRIFSLLILVLSVLFVIFIFTGCKQKEQPSETKQSQRSSLRILYAGHPGSDREKDFVEFLAKYFKNVHKGDLKAFKDSDAEGYDVTILDYDGDGFKAPRPSISRHFSRPIVTVGVVGAFICDQQSLKTGYL